MYRSRPEKVFQVTALDGILAKKIKAVARSQHLAEKPLDDSI